jgi:tetratricopeptide (TPR) repeat protein
LHVESVAWIAERKDVLCGFFWLLTLVTYFDYVKNRTWVRYLLVILTFCLGLMAKPMIVTLPAVLLLLDVWPLGRSFAVGLLWEKVPMVILSAAVSIETYVAQWHGGAVDAVSVHPLSERIGNSLVSYVTYIVKFFWPANLSVFYPYPKSVPVGQALVAGLVLIGITVFALRSFRNRRYLTVGWLWFLVTTLPVIGLVPVGAQARADRYTYIPLIGLGIMVAWGAQEAIGRWPAAKSMVVGSLAVACCGFLFVTWFQLHYWRSSADLFRHAISATKGNYVAYNNLGVALKSQGHLDEAAADFYEAIGIQPNFADGHVNLGIAFADKGRLTDALVEISEAVRLNPASSDAHLNRALVLKMLGRMSDSVSEYRQAIQIQPDNAEAYAGLGGALAAQGKTEEALASLRTSIGLQPGYASGHYGLGCVLAAAGQMNDAVAEFSAAIRLQPDFPEAHYNLGTALAARQRLNEAVDEFGLALKLRPDYAKAHFSLGAALAILGRVDEAIPHFAEAVRIDPTFSDARESLEYALSLQNKAKKQ